MKSSMTLAVAVILMAFNQAFTQVPNEGRRQLAEELLNLMNVRETTEKTFANIKQTMPDQMKKMGEAMGQTNRPAASPVNFDKMMDMITQELSWDNMKEDYITLYANTFSEEELKGVIAFYKSPVGQAFSSKQSELASHSMEISQKMMLKIMPKIQELTQKMVQESAASNQPPSESQPENK